MMLAFLQNISAQCTAAGEGQYPASTVALNTNCTPKVVTSSAWTDEYSRLSGAGANTYVFTSSVATDFLTVTDEATNTVIAFGVTPLSYTFGAAPGDIRIYRHDNNTCPATSSTSRTITVTCTSCAGPGAPTCPTLTAPTNNATGVSTLPTLTWSAATNAVTYDVYIDADATCTITPTTLVATVATTSYTLSSSLAPSTSYRWMIVPKDCGGAAPASCTPFCFTTTVAPPANDNCTGTNGTPVALTPQSFATSCSSPVAATTVGATQSNTNCSTTATNDDVWFSFTANATTETVRFEGVTAVTGTVTSMGMDTYTTCGGTNSNCNSSVTLVSGAGQGSLTGLTIGTTYFLRVWTGGASNSATFNICIIDPPPPPANDNCATATAFPTIPTDGTCVTLTNQSTASATNSNVTPSGSCTSNSGTPDDDVWFSFVAPGPTVILQATLASGVSDVYWQVFSSACGSSMVSILCTDNNGGGTLTGLTTGATYYIRLYTWSASVITSQDICLKTPPPPPGNDNCAGATSFGVSAFGACSFSSVSTGGGTQSTPNPSCTTTGNNDDIWFIITPATNGVHTIRYNTLTAITGTASTVGYDLYTGACGSLTAVAGACNTGFGSGGSGTVSTPTLSAGTTYYLRLWVGASGNSGSWNMCVEEPIANDLCSGAITITNGSSISVNNSAATDETTAQAPTCSGISTNTNGLWYVFQSTPNVAETITLEGCNSTFDMRVKVYTGSCATPTCLTGDDSDDCNGPGSGLAETTSFNVPSSPSAANYYIFISGPDGTLEFNLAVVLPLELTKFEGKSMSKSNMLTWETALEKDVQWHIVERAADGVNFTEVGRTAGQLASSAPKKYELEDLRPIGKAYYRLRSVDLDGKESLSSVIVLERKGARFQIDNVFPSPTQGDLTVQFNAVEESAVNVMVYDFSGRLVLQQQLDAVKGFNQTTLQLGSLPAGMYNVTIVGTQSATEPVRIVKE